MKKIAPFVILFLFALLAWDVFVNTAGMTLSVDGEPMQGPLGALFATLFAGGGAIIAALAMVVAVAVLALVFAGVGVLLLVLLAVCAVAVAAAISPLLLPLLLPAVVIWFLMHRARRNRLIREQAV
jgi:hypothetical protein